MTRNVTVGIWTSIAVLVITNVFFWLNRCPVEMFVVDSMLDIQDPVLPSIGTRFQCSTRNMSYDLRQDIPIKRQHWKILDSPIGNENPEKCLNKSVFTS